MDKDRKYRPIIVTTFGIRTCGEILRNARGPLHSAEGSGGEGIDYPTLPGGGTPIEYGIPERIKERRGDWLTAGIAPSNSVIFGRKLFRK